MESINRQFANASVNDDIAQEQVARNPEVKANSLEATTRALTQEQIDNYKIDGKPFQEWCKIDWTNGNPNWIAKAVTTTTPYDALRCLIGKFSNSTKTKDADKILPRQERLNLIMKEKCDPGSTAPPNGTSKASWKHDIKQNWIHTLGDTSLVGTARYRNPFLIQVPNKLYKKSACTPSKLEDYESYHRQTVRPGEHREIPSETPLESFYIIFVDNHIDETGRHWGRDLTIKKINKAVSTSICKELISVLIKYCPGCNTRDNLAAREKTVAGSRHTREVRYSVHPKNTRAHAEMLMNARIQQGHQAHNQQHNNNPQHPQVGFSQHNEQQQNNNAQHLQIGFNQHNEQQYDNNQGAQIPQWVLEDDGCYYKDATDDEVRNLEWMASIIKRNAQGFGSAGVGFP